jgi:hypothetical protein
MTDALGSTFDAYRHRILVLAPRPTHVSESFELETALPTRDAAWMETQRRRFEHAVGRPSMASSQLVPGCDGECK